MRSDEIMARPGACRARRVRRSGRGVDATASGIHAEFSVGGMRKVYRGSNIEVSFDLDICIHIGECLRGERNVFKLDRRPWVLPDASEADAVAHVVELCPSGALQYHRLDGKPQENPPETTTMTPMRDGPLLVKGRGEVKHED